MKNSFLFCFLHKLILFLKYLRFCGIELECASVQNIPQCTQRLKWTTKLTYFCFYCAKLNCGKLVWMWNQDGMVKQRNISDRRLSRKYTYDLTHALQYICTIYTYEVCGVNKLQTKLNVFPRENLTLTHFFVLFYFVTFLY